MTVFDVIRQVLLYLNEPELCDTVLLGGTEEPTDQQKEKVNLLINCVNDSIQTIATMYFPLKKEEVVTSANGIYSFDLFSKPLLDILKVMDSRLRYTVDFSMFADHFESKVGSLLVVYTYLPTDVEFVADKLEIVENKVTARMVAMSVMSKYYMILGMYQDAANWEEMFERAVLVAKRRKDNIVLKKRRWI